MLRVFPQGLKPIERSYFMSELKLRPPKEATFSAGWKRRRLVALLALGLAGASTGVFSVPADAQGTSQAKQIGGKFMCMCGCNQVLTQCNHVGCTTSTSMLKELDQGVARGDSEDVITQAFVQEFGTKVYAEPPKSGLSLVAWSLPSVYLVLGTAIVIFVIFRWRARPAQQIAAAGVPSGISQDELERARQRVARETED
jgi:cytochrome c-type biogenesis protein CcmH/NrfF